MNQWSRGLLKRYREPLCYLVVGLCTTAINYGMYAALHAVGLHYMLGNALAWCSAVAFAYFANGRWVYRSTSRRGIREAGAFVASRLFSLGLESGMLYLLVELARLGVYPAKLLTAVVVVVVNYLTGLLVYGRGKR